MNYIRTASFGGLFGVTFAVAASFQLAFSLLGFFLALTVPSAFNLNGAPAASPIQAIVVLVILLVAGLTINAAMSALGALIVMVWRRLLPAALPLEMHPPR